VRNDNQEYGGIKLKKYQTVDEYINDLPEMEKEVSQIMRELFQDAVPDGVEGISYNMPSIKLEGKTVAYFATAKNHLGFYPTPEPIERFESELKGFETSKGTIQIPYVLPLPASLIRKIIEYRVSQRTDN